MSEYFYYEFQAIDRRLTDREMRELRAISSRATITPTSFTNDYSYGSFRGNPDELVEKYFDAYFFLGCWNAFEVMFRLPTRLLSPEVAARYCVGGSAVARTKGDHVILDFVVEDVEGDCSDGGEGRLSSVISARADLARGDLSLLYLGWLLCVQHGDVDDAALEPPVPPGLPCLTGSLEAFADILQIDPDLVAAAATSSTVSTPEPAAPEDVVARISALPEREKTALLTRVLYDDPHVGLELQKRFATVAPGKASSRRPRTVGEIRAMAHELAAARVRAEEERRAAEQVRRARETAEARERFLSDLARRAPAAWERVEALIATKQQPKYDEAVKLLVDLREVAERESGAEATDTRIAALAGRHSLKVSLIERMTRAGLRVSLVGAR